MSVECKCCILVTASRSHSHQFENTNSCPNDIYDQFVIEFWIPFIKYVKITHPEIKVFLIYGNQITNQDNIFEEIKDNIIFTNVEEDEQQKNFILKLFEGFKFVRTVYPDCKTIFKTNLSNFFLIDSFIKIVNYLNSKKQVYAGYLGGDSNFSFCSGAGFFLSIDLVDYILNSDILSTTHIDDVAYGHCLIEFPRIGLPRLDLVYMTKLLSEDELLQLAQIIKTYGLFHVRTRNYNREIDIQVVKFLTKYFYS
jgi:hypothetical protein